MNSALILLIKKNCLYEFERRWNKNEISFENKNMFKLIIVNLKIIKSFDNLI